MRVGVMSGKTLQVGQISHYPPPYLQTLVTNSDFTKILNSKFSLKFTKKIPGVQKTKKNPDKF